MSDAKTRILLLDDHPVILDGLAAFLGSEPDFAVVSRCATAQEAESAFQTVGVDVAIVDVKVQSGYTFDFVAKAQAAHPAVRFLFITGHEDDVFVERAFAAGASGYVLKSEALPELVKAVRAALAGQRYVSPQLRVRFASDSTAKVPGAEVQTRLSLLTKREREVLKQVSQGHSAKEISEILKISTWTVTNHKANIMAKLDIHNQVGLTRFAVSTGLA